VRRPGNRAGPAARGPQPPPPARPQRTHVNARTHVPAPYRAGRRASDTRGQIARAPREGHFGHFRRRVPFELPPPRHHTHCFGKCCPLPLAASGKPTTFSSPSSPEAATPHRTAPRRAAREKLRRATSFPPIAMPEDKEYAPVPLGQAAAEAAAPDPEDPVKSPPRPSSPGTSTRKVRIRLALDPAQPCSFCHTLVASLGSGRFCAAALFNFKLPFRRLVFASLSREGSRSWPCAGPELTTLDAFSGQINAYIFFLTYYFVSALLEVVCALHCYRERLKSTCCGKWQCGGHYNIYAVGNEGLGLRRYNMISPS
jgi:hypothetical protein